MFFWVRGFRRVLHVLPLLVIGLVISTFSGATWAKAPVRNELNLNNWDFHNDPYRPNWDFLTDRYQPSSLSRAELQEIAGTRRESHDFRGHKQMLRNSVTYVLKLKYLESDKDSWSSLAEKRYSFFRDLFNEIEAATDSSWYARDFKLRDGSFVFMGHLGELLIIRIQDGALIKEHRGYAFLNNDWDLKPDLPIIMLKEEALESSTDCASPLLKKAA
jgi:hypothetical protein